MSKLDQAAVPFATITELSAALRSRELSSLELTKIFSERLEKLGPEYNALACLIVKNTKRQAKDVDWDLKRERFRGRLQGIPYAVKDLIAVANYPTTWGAKPFAGQVFDEDATVIQKLNDQHAVLIGKLSMIELAGGGNYSSAAASLQGPCLNPWNKMYWAGGSSSGSGAAVSAGLVPYALGSETSGSILTPASYCGVTGLRPTYGLVSRRGAMALSWTLDKLGVFARCADDCGWVLGGIAGKDNDDPGSAGKGFHYSPQYYQRLDNLKVGYAEIDFAEWPDEPLRPAFQNVLAIFKSIKTNMVETTLPDFPYGPVIDTIIDSEAASIFEQFIKSGQVNQLADVRQVAGLKAALNYSAVDYLKAMRIRSQIQTAFRQLFVTVDVLIAPTHFSPPDRADQPFDENEPKGPDRRGVGKGLVQASNLCGFPAITIPGGFVNGLPIAMQIVGPPFSENRIIALAHEFQKRANFHKQRPPVPA
jgi:Asp-tRNA(Asn)/Glu-tRNA(Gln) amidotransferase A subunit family amidase